MEKYSIEYIDHLLNNNTRAVERGILAIYNNQTPAEKEVKKTIHNNGVGFSEIDARLGTYYAQWILNGNKLSGSHLERARKMTLKYKNQLLKIAKIKEQNALSKR